MKSARGTVANISSLAPRRRRAALTNAELFLGGGTGDEGTGEYLERQERGRPEGGVGEREKKLKVDKASVLKANHI